MRKVLILLPMLLTTAPALAQPPAPQLPPELSDPKTAERLTNTMQALSKAFLDLPVGNVQAAIEGRQPSAADRRRTVGSESRLSERDIRARIDAARPRVEQSLKALSEALPSMLRGLEQARQSLERAAANMPDPTYPKR